MAKAKWVRPPRPQEITDEGGKYYFDGPAAEHVRAFFEKWLVHIEGEWSGQPFRLLDWQYEEIIKPAFGWKRSVDGLRRFRRVYVEIPKKNGKSMTASGVGLYLTGADGEPGAHVYSAATSEAQARVVFDASKELIGASKLLTAFFKPTHSRITVPLTRSFFQVLSKTSESKHGIKPHGVIFDELHALKKPDLYNVLTEGSGASRREPMIFTITTAGTDKTSIGWREHQHALNVLDGVVNDAELLVVIYAADEDDDWTLPAVWRKTNPSLGVTIKEEFLAATCERAKSQPHLQNLFKQLHLNVWCSVSSRWLSQSVWNACRGEIDAETLRGRPCWGGLDLSTTKDISALVWLFEIDGKLVLLPHFFIPRGNIGAREKQDAVRYSQWIASGHMTATEGNSVDYRVIRKKAEEGKQMFAVQDIGFDKWNATETVAELISAGFKMVEVPQGFRMSASAKEFERLLLARQILHPGNPALDWMAGNVEVITSAQENIRLVKPFSQDAATQRIDGIVAAVMALERYTRRAAKKTSIYEKGAERLFI